MPDIIGQNLRRLEALEAAVNGRASEHIERNVSAGRFPPPDGVTNGHAWWWLATLERHDRLRQDRRAGGVGLAAKASRYTTRPLLSHWIFDIDTTVKPLYCESRMW
jgi:hypothetical protein